MTGDTDEPGVKQIEEVDRDVDLYFVLLHRTENSGPYRSDLFAQVQDLDPAPFAFPIPTEYRDFMENLRFLEALGAINTLRQRRAITLTEKGVEIADQLIDALDHDQLTAIDEVLE